jgi:hypothetical protein
MNRMPASTGRDVIKERIKVREGETVRTGERGTNEKGAARKFAARQTWP